MYASNSGGSVANIFCPKKVASIFIPKTMSLTTTIVSKPSTTIVVPTHTPLPLICLPEAQQKFNKGAQGVVYKGKLNKNDVAIKYIACTSQRKKEEIQTEISAWVAVQTHPNICTWHGWYRVPQSKISSIPTYALVTELCTGGELFDKLEKGGVLSCKDALDLYYSLFDAVNHIHTCGYIHCDIKLENIVLDEKGVPKLIDFGLVNCSNAGTPPYASPEVYKHQLHRGIDVWALGVCLFATISGFFPFKIAKDTDWRFRTLSHSCSFCQNIFACYGLQCTFAQSMMNLIDGMMKVELKERFTMQQVLTSTVNAKDFTSNNAVTPTTTFVVAKRSLSAC